MEPWLHCGAALEPERSSLTTAPGDSTDQALPAPQLSAAFLKAGGWRHWVGAGESVVLVRRPTVGGANGPAM